MPKHLMEFQMGTLAERVAEALEQAQATAPYKNKAGLAKHCGIRPSSVTDWFSGKTKTIGYKHAILAAEYLQVSASWLADGTGDMKSPSVRTYEGIENGDNLADSEFIIIPQYYVQASAGPGNENEIIFEEVKDPEGGFIKPRSWFQTHLINPDNCKTFLVHGDSMEPYLWDGDKILVDCSPEDIISGKVYVFMINGKMRVKVLRPLINGLLIRSFNPEIPDETLTANDLETFKLIGRVRDRAGNSWL
nr:MAG TPA: Repressor protein CI [Caudoviricetes sp.]